MLVRTVHIVDPIAERSQAMARLLEASNFVQHTYATPFDLFLCSPRAGCILMDVQERRVDWSRIGFCLPVIVIGTMGDLRAAVGAKKQGAFDFVEAPFDDRVLLGVIDAALESSGSIIAM
jgi:FixJ family two-component response regulator